MIVGLNLDEDGDLSIINFRWLRYKNKELNNEEQYYLWSRKGNKLT